MNSSSEQKITRSTENSETKYNLPSDATLKAVAKLSIVEDKPIMLDYWTDSLDKKSFIGIQKHGGDKILVKSEDQYTSTIQKLYKTGEEFIIITENSIYVVSATIPKKSIS